MRIKKTEEERIASIEAELARLQKQRNKIAAAKRAKDAALEKRRAFLMGEAILNYKDAPTDFLDTLSLILDETYQAGSDRNAISDLLPPGPALRRPLAMGG